MMDMAKLHDAFAEAYQGKLFPDEFRGLLRDLFNVEYDEEEFKILFMKVNCTLILTHHYRYRLIIPYY